MSLIALLLAQAAAAQAAGRGPAGMPLSPPEIAAAAPASEWLAIPPEDLLVVDLAPDTQGRARRVFMQLMPAPLTAPHVANVRLLAAAHWFDGTSVNRVQDNYVAQWGDATERKPLPPGLATIPESAYETSWRALPGARLPADRPRHITDVYAPAVFWWRGWPLATDLAPAARRRTWPVHCYGSVGVGRDVSPNTGTGAELYAVIGHAPRHLDRNIAVVGRVVEGIEHLSSLPRGTLALGFYATPAERTAIRRIRLASELPADERPRFEYLSTEGAAWPRYRTARMNREGPFFFRPAGAADVCNVPVPVRRGR